MTLRKENQERVRGLPGKELVAQRAGSEVSFLPQFCLLSYYRPQRKLSAKFGKKHFFLLLQKIYTYPLRSSLCWHLVFSQQYGVLHSGVTQASLALHHQNSGIGRKKLTFQNHCGNVG